ncbi:uncharacterized protein LOC100178273 [Ciona intestinalis]
MKVIIAGYPKTGTKSLTSALRTLGYTVYDYLENFQFLCNDWETVLTEGGNSEDFYRMYNGVDATLDSPVFVFWEELHRTFPDAKVILPIRDEDKWIVSFKKQCRQIDDHMLMKFYKFFTPTGRRYQAYTNTWVTAALGTPLKTAFHKTPVNELLYRTRYRQHNKYVTEVVDADKLLVYQVKDGWEPLCQFLEKDVPETAFPHANVGGTFFRDNMETHPVLLRMKNEMITMLSLIAVIISFVIFLF